MERSETRRTTPAASREEPARFDPPPPREPMPRSATGEPDDGGELREMAYRRAGVTSQWKRSTWFWSILGLAAAVLVVAGFVVPAETQAGYVLFSLAYCGLALAAVVLLMTSLRSRKGEDEQLRPSP